MPRPATSIATLCSIALGAILAVAGWHGVDRWEARFRPASLIAETPAAARGAGPTVGLLFSPEGCAGRLDIVDSLNAAYRRGVAVVGWLTVDPYRFPGWRDLVAAQRIEFPVVPVSPARARRATAVLGQRAPLLLVLQGERVTFLSDAPDGAASLAYLTGLGARSATVP